MKRRELLGAFGVAGTVLLAGCGGNGDDPTETPSETGVDFTIDSSELSVEDGTATVTGTATNTSGGSLALAEIDATFLDGDGTEVGMGSDSTAYWPSEATWDFEVTYDGDGASSVEDYELAKTADTGV